MTLTDKGNPYICFFDLETTGLDKKTDRIIQIALLKYEKSSGQIINKFETLIQPDGEYEIREEAFQKHGICKNDLKDAPFLKNIIDEITFYVKDADMGGYNIARFDIPFLQEELRKCGVELNMSNRVIYDQFVAECRLRPRNLSTVYKQYTGNELVDAHNALADIEACIPIFEGQLSEFGDGECYERLYDPSGFLAIRYNEEKQKDEIVFILGKYKGTSFMDVCEKDMNYLNWMLRSDFSTDTKNIIQKGIKVYQRKNNEQ